MPKPDNFDERSPRENILVLRNKAFLSKLILGFYPIFLTFSEIPVYVMICLQMNSTLYIRLL